MTVQALLNQAQVYVADLTGTAGAAMNRAIASTAGIGYIIPNYYPVVMGNTPPSSISYTFPVLDTINLDMPAEPTTAPVFQDISDITLGVLPELTVTAPTITLPTKPNQVAEFLSVAPGIDTNIKFPEPPDELMNPLIPAPVLSTRTEPTAPTIGLPSFDGVAPASMSAAPTDYETRYTRAYADAAPSMISMINGYVDSKLLAINPQFNTQMVAIETQLTKYLAGGTGLNAAAENAIYERARTKVSAETQRAQDESWNAAAERGFTMPYGFHLSALRQVRQGGANSLAEAAREIVVIQAEYEQKNLQFAVTQSMALRSMVLNATLSYMQNLAMINGQALDYAKTVLLAIIEIYNTSVKAFAAQLDAYKAETVAYEARLKAAMSYIELYQAEINALNALVQVDQSRVQLYRVQIESLVALSNVYRAQIEVVQGRVNLEKLQLDVFQSQVQAYTAQVQGKNAEWQGYTAAIAGESARVNIYGEQVRAYGAQVMNHKTAIEAKSEQVKAQAMRNQALASNYNSTLQGYTAVVEARGKKASLTLENQRQVLLSFNAQLAAEVANAGVQNTYYKTIADVAIANANQRTTVQVEQGHSTRAYGDTIARLNTANATIYANLAQAGLSGMNTLAAQTAAE